MYEWLGSGWWEGCPDRGIYRSDYGFVVTPGVHDGSMTCGWWVSSHTRASRPAEALSRLHFAGHPMLISRQTSIIGFPFKIIYHFYFFPPRLLSPGFFFFSSRYCLRDGIYAGRRIDRRRWGYFSRGPVRLNSVMLAVVGWSFLRVIYFMTRPTIFDLPYPHSFLPTMTGARFYSCHPTRPFLAAVVTVVAMTGEWRRGLREIPSHP